MNMPFCPRSSFWRGKIARWFCWIKETKYDQEKFRFLRGTEWSTNLAKYWICTCHYSFCCAKLLCILFLYYKNIKHRYRTDLLVIRHAYCTSQANHVIPIRAIKNESTYFSKQKQKKSPEPSELQLGTSYSTYIFTKSVV